MRGKIAVGLLALAMAILLTAPTVQGVTGTGRKGCTNPEACPKVSTPTNLYFHIFDVFNSFPINTQKPPATEEIEVGGTNFPTVVEPTTGTNYDFNTIYGYSTAGLVEYDYIENGQPRFHPERGIADDVLIDDQTDRDCGGVMAKACVRIYVSVRDVLGTQSVPNFMPKYTFKATVAEKNVLNEEELVGAQVIMQGELTYHLASEEFAGQSSPDGTPIKTPNEDGVVEYAIPMSIVSKVIPKTQGYHVRIDWYQDPDGENPDKAAQGYMRLVNNAEYRPRLEMNILNPIYIEFIHPEVAAGILLIHTAENSPWGTYDADVRNITVAINDGQRDLHIVIVDVGGNVIYDSGGDGPIDATLQIVISQNAHVHDLHGEPAEVTYLWRYREQGAADGEYSITITVKNRDQEDKAHTAYARDTAKFVLKGKEAYGISQAGETVAPIPETEGPGAKGSPGAGLLLLVVFVALAFLARRRVA
jgi:hypothetical protein